MKRFKVLKALFDIALNVLEEILWKFLISSRELQQGVKLDAHFVLPHVYLVDDGLHITNSKRVETNAEYHPQNGNNFLCDCDSWYFTVTYRGQSLE